MEGVAQDSHHTQKHSTWSSHKKKEEAAIKVMMTDDDPVLYYRENTIRNSNLYKLGLIL